MKVWLFLTLFVSVPLYFVSSVDANEPGSVGEAKVVMIQYDDDANVEWIASGDGEDGASANVIVELIGDESDGGQWVRQGDGNSIAIAIGTGNGDGDTKHNIRVMKRNLAGDSKTAFLGVTLVATSDDVGGLRITSVVDNSPASKAGLEAGDIIVSIGDDSTESGHKALTQALKDRQPGDEVDVVVIRDGNEEIFSVLLGTRGDITRSFVARLNGIGEIEDQVKARGHIVLRNVDGDWEVKDLGDLEAIKDLPTNIRMFMPKMGSRSIEMSDDNGESVITIKTASDGESITVERRGEDDITVTRVDGDSEKTIDTYADEDELQQSDEEAFVLLQGIASSVHGFNFEGIGVEDGTFDFKFDLDTEDLHENLMQWRSELDGTLGEARVAFEIAMEELGDMKQDLHDQHRGKFERLNQQFRQFSQDGDGNSFKFPGTAKFEFLAKAKHAFEVRSDGTIEVKIRKGDSELVQLFDDASDMEDREPALYLKYRKLMDENE